MFSIECQSICHSVCLCPMPVAQKQSSDYYGTLIRNSMLEVKLTSELLTMAVWPLKVAKMSFRPKCMSVS